MTFAVADGFSNSPTDWCEAETGEKKKRKADT